MTASVADLGLRRGVGRRRLQGRLDGLPPGQTTVEWLMIAGLLTAMFTVIGTLVARQVLRYGVNLIWSVRTIAP
jgi:hypothetical protein